MPSLPYYVILTGDKTNSGDHLIKESALALFKKYRPDREVIALPGWEKMDNSRLETVNQSCALILCGGPALRMHTYGDVYKLTNNLDEIKVPIILMGIGYRDDNGEWENTFRFELSDKTHDLLKKTQVHEYSSSVRCYHTLNVLKSHGYKNVMMSGCPAFYEIDNLEREFPLSPSVQKIAFATGRKYLTIPGMDRQQMDLISSFAQRFKDKNFTVAFHDPIDMKKPKTLELIDFLKSNSIEFVDISGTADTLTDFYKQMDAQIGYRVHAHIYMSSIQKPTILLCEDGRGKGMRSTIPGVILNAYEYKPLNKKQLIANKISGKIMYHAIQPIPELQEDVWRQWEDESNNNWKRNRIARHAIHEHLATMQKMIAQLP